MILSIVCPLYAFQFSIGKALQSDGVIGLIRILLCIVAAVKANAPTYAEVPKTYQQNAPSYSEVPKTYPPEQQHSASGTVSNQQYNAAVQPKSFYPVSKAGFYILSVRLGIRQ